MSCSSWWSTSIIDDRSTAVSNPATGTCAKARQRVPKGRLVKVGFSMSKKTKQGRCCGPRTDRAGELSSNEARALASSSVGAVNASLMTAVAVLTDWRLVRTIRCEAIVVSGGQRRVYGLHAEPNHSSYAYTAVGTGRQSSFVDATRERIDSGIRVPHQSSDRIWHPLAVRLAFPPALPIWGRRHDGYRMVDADERDEQLVVQLAGRDDDTLSGSLAIDSTRGLAMRLDVPALSLEYRDVESAPSRLRGD